MQPIIKTNAWYTLVTGKSEVINASWCKQQLARILKKSTDAIILFDVTGSYAALVLDHDRLIPGQLPMAVSNISPLLKALSLHIPLRLMSRMRRNPGFWFSMLAA